MNFMTTLVPLARRMFRVNRLLDIPPRTLYAVGGIKHQEGDLP
jgi:hypothetical protein